VRHVTRIGEERNTFRLFGGKNLKKKSLGRPRHRRDITEMAPK
jgi:hypothetical protein